MKRIKRKKRKNYRIFIYFLLFVLIAFTISSAYSYIIKSLKIDGVSAIKKSETSNMCLGKVTYEINSWVNNYNTSYRIVFTLTNNGDKDYNDWKVYFDIPEDFELVNYSSVEPKIIGTKIELGSIYYNSYIQPGSSISFEIQFTTSNSNFEPNNISISNCYISHDNESSLNNLQISFNFVAKNDAYTYQYDVVVTNIGSDAITNWSFNIVKPRNAKMVNIWNANYIVKDETIEFSNVSYNGNILPGGSTSFGFIIYTDEYQYRPSLYE